MFLYKPQPPTLLFAVEKKGFYKVICGAHIGNASGLTWVLKTDTFTDEWDIHYNHGFESYPFYISRASATIYTSYSLTTGAKVISTFSIEATKVEDGSRHYSLECWSANVTNLNATLAKPFVNEKELPINAFLGIKVRPKAGEPGTKEQIFKNFKSILPFGLAMTTILLAAIVCLVLTEKRTFVKGPKRVVHAAQTSELAHEEHGGEDDQEEFDHDQALRYTLVDYYYGYAEETLGEESYSEYV
ncbi:hypothetical protein RRG08_019714 [Elysia crispata]|uniref:Uncharacterized protein n=1 Tax=Elysia crispata TaxID=231223 RepID=A0AAE1B4W0_9GAST|nr:hypothetical protein RRG08_019714 [Elysia crispata]